MLGLLGSSLISGCGGGRAADNRREEIERNQTAIKKRAVRQARPAAPPAQRRIDCAKVKCVALTFDDGPGDHTRTLLDGLRRSGTRATFFVLGTQVGRHRDLVRRMVHEGHEIGNHSWSHPIMAELPPTEVRSEVRHTQQAVKSAAGVSPKLFRPPYGETNEQVGRVVDMPQILWSVDCMDWHHKKARKGIDAGVKQARSGGIILLHDTSRLTVATAPKIVSTLKQRGFTLVTVSELFQFKRLQAAALYTGLE